MRLEIAGGLLAGSASIAAGAAIIYWPSEAAHVILSMSLAVFTVSAFFVARDLWRSGGAVLFAAPDNPALIGPAHTDAPPQRDTPIRKAIYYVVTGDWRDNPDFQTEKLTDPVFQACADIRQHALDGNLTIWGKRTFARGGVYLKVPEDEWSRIAVDVLRVLFLKNAEGGAKDDKRMSGALEYEDLWTSRAQIERLFPDPPLKHGPE